MQLRIEYGRYSSWIKVSYEPYLASYVAYLSNRSLYNLRADLKLLAQNHENFALKPSQFIETARGYECTIVMTEKPLTFGAYDA